MSLGDIPFSLSYFAAGAAAIKIVEWLLSFRHRLSAAVQSDNEGDDVVIFNGAARPWNVHYFSLEWAKDGFCWRFVPFGWRRLKTEFDGDGESTDITIPAHGQRRLTFADSDAISWKQHQAERLYLVLWLTGRKGPVRLRIK